MISTDEYPVYNSRERPGIGRDYLGHTYYNCFSITLERDETGRYLPYLFSDFIKQYNQYTKYSGTCDSCILRHKILTYPVDGIEINRSAVAKKFSCNDVDESFYYYCPLIQKALLASKLGAEVASVSSGDLPAEPIQAILGGNWDDDYLFDFHKIEIPSQILICNIWEDILSSRFVSTSAERSFLIMWVLSMFQCMEIVRQSGQKIYFEDSDFDQFRSKILNFLFPVPQVWIYVIPKPPPNSDWREWEQLIHVKKYPQRVDFLFTYGGERHIVELDDIRHYGEPSSGDTWIASETKYRKTLSESRLLRSCGYDVHRFTNKEILELYNPDSSQNPDIKGFITLLRSEGLKPENMVLLKG
jgi:hypothetical protein